MERPNFHGQWVLDRNDEHYEDFLKENGANWMSRKMATKLTDEMDIQQDGDQMKVVTFTATLRREAKFKVGEPYDDIRPNGTKATVTPSWDENKLIVESISQDKEKSKDVTVIRELVGEELKQIMKVSDVVTCRYFKRK